MKTFALAHPALVLFTSLAMIVPTQLAAQEAPAPKKAVPYTINKPVFNKPDPNKPAVNYTTQPKQNWAELELEGATIYDGTGGAPYVGNVAIRNGKIIAVSDTSGITGAYQRIDCRGLVIAPGFIDLHTHSDGPIVEPTTRANVNYLTQGVTTVITGNCGFGPVDVAAFLKKIDEQGAGSNVCHLLPHGSLRDAVMGKTARDPTPEELEKMRSLAEQAMRDGAWGMATGLIYVPATYSKTEEIALMAKVVGAHGGIYASHIRDEGEHLVRSIEEALEIGRRGELPVHISHFKASGKSAWGSLHLAVATIEKARAAGRKVTADQYPYTASSTSLEATLLPNWSREGGRSAIIDRVRDPVQRAKIRAEVERAIPDKVKIQIAGYSPRRNWVGKSLDEIAVAEKRPAADIALEMEEQGGARVVVFNMNEDDMRLAMKLPWVATASDGSAKMPDADRPHPRSFGTFTRKLGVYAIREKAIPLEQAIRSASGLPADILGLKDRGYLQVGQAADFVVFDPKTLIDRATYEEPYLYSAGMKYVYVNGKPAIFDGTPTGALVGKALRHVKP